MTLIAPGLWLQRLTTREPSLDQLEVSIWEASPATLFGGGLPAIGLGGGGLSGATNPAQRKLSQASEQISYGLYQDAARAQPWGDSAGSNTAPGQEKTTSEPGRLITQRYPCLVPGLL